MQVIPRYSPWFSGFKTGYCQTTNDIHGALSKISPGFKDERVTRRRGEVSGGKEYLTEELASELQSA